MDRRILLIPLVIAGLTVGYATGISQSNEAFDARIKEMSNANFERLKARLSHKLLQSGGKLAEGDELKPDTIGNYADALGKVLDKPKGYELAYYIALNDYEARAFMDSIPQMQAAAAQAQIELSIIRVEQNRKIIELLTELTEDKKE